MEEDESKAGEILYIEEETKSLPMMLTALLIGGAILLIFLQYWGVLVAVLICAIPFIVYRATYRRVIEFGTEGYVLHETVFKKTTTAVVTYDQVSNPKVSITDNLKLGMHVSYEFEVDYGTIAFHYITCDSDAEDLYNFDYFCSHHLYRCRNLYLTGEEKDYEEDMWVLQSTVNRLINY